MHHALKIVVATGANAAAPAQFGASDWAVADLGNDGEAYITVTTLPDDGGSTITDLEYQIDGGSWVSLGGTETGYYGISGLTNAVAADVSIRAVNAGGGGTASATKAVTPTRGGYENAMLQVVFGEANGATTGADDSANNFDWTGVGNADVQSNKMPLDGAGDYLTFASDAHDWNFLHNGTPWTIEFNVTGRPTNANNLVFDTIEASTGTNSRGAAVWITSAGVLRVLIARAESAVPLIDYTSTLTVPSDGADHHIAIEWDWGDGSAVTDAIRVGLDGTREDMVDRANKGFTATDSTYDLRLGRRANGTTNMDYNGTVGPFRIHRDKLFYDLLNNATYTQAASSDWPTAAVNGPKSFAARFFPSEETAAAGSTWDTYRCEPRIVAGASAGTYYCFAMVGSSHADNVTMEIVRWTSTDYGRTWGSYTTIATDATYACRNHSVGQDSNGVIIVCYRKADASNVTQGVFYRTSGDSFATETEITSSLDGTFPWGKAVETSDGLLFTFYKGGAAECLYWNAGTTSFGTAVAIYSGESATINEPFAISDGADTVVWVARKSGSGNNDFRFYKSTNAGATTSFVEEVQWTATTFDDVAPAALERIGDKILCVWSSRGTDYKIKYTVATLANFWSDPGRMMDGTETINTLRQMRSAQSPDSSNFGYPDIIALRNDLALVTNYEQTNAAANTTRLWAQTLAI